MTLRLSVVSDHASRLGQHATKVFGVHGGTIGRGPDNAWILPDPDRYLSGKHVRIDFRAGNYVLVDTSSNGTYVNSAQVPLGKYHDYVLKDGDYVRMGEYEMLVSIDKSNDFPTEDGAVVAFDGKSASSAAKQATADDLGADLDLSQLLEPSDQLSADVAEGARNAYGQAAGPVREPPKPESENAGVPWHMMTRPLKVENVPTSELAARAQNPTLYEGDYDVGLASFCRGAGVDPRNITSEARSVALQLAGQLLRETVLGLMELNQSRTDFRNRFRISAPADEGNDSPLNLSRGVDEALVRLLTTVSTRMGSVEAVRDAFRDLKAHNGASLAAMRLAFEEFIDRVDPKELQERFDRATKRGVFGSNNKAKYWDLYAEMFGGLAQRPPDGFPHLFAESFSKAYEAKLRTLTPPKRSAFAPDRDAADEAGDSAVRER